MDIPEPDLTVIWRQQWYRHCAAAVHDAGSA
jgi:hypothetical protein